MLRYCYKLWNQWKTELRLREREIERGGCLLNKTSWEHFHVSLCWLGWRKPKLDLSNTATKAPSNQQLRLCRSSSWKHNWCKGNLIKQELISHELATANTDTLRDTIHIGNYSLWEDLYVCNQNTHTETGTPTMRSNNSDICFTVTDFSIKNQ